MRIAAREPELVGTTAPAGRRTDPVVMKTAKVAVNALRTHKQKQEVFEVKAELHEEVDIIINITPTASNSVGALAWDLSGAEEGSTPDLSPTAAVYDIAAPAGSWNLTLPTSSPSSHYDHCPPPPHLPPPEGVVRPVSVGPGCF
jgi:hypothetical protein